MSDAPALANAIEDAGIERAKAEHIAAVIIDAVRNNVAAKADLQALLSTAHTELKAEVTGLRIELKSDVAALRAELKADIATLRADLRDVEARLAAEIVRVTNRSLIRASGVLVVVVVLLGVLLAVLR